jgi:hypothetical protein
LTLFSLLLYFFFVGANRAAQAARAASKARALIAMLEKHGLPPGFYDVFFHLTCIVCIATSPSSDGGTSLRHATAALAAELDARRHYAKLHVDAKQPQQTSIEFDPRFLVFEYVFDLLLRERQVAIVDSFAAEATAGGSRVQQMLMGQGKTTVVGPLLTLLLADGDHLVVHVNEMCVAYFVTLIFVA